MTPHPELAVLSRRRLVLGALGVAALTSLPLIAAAEPTNPNLFPAVNLYPGS